MLSISFTYEKRWEAFPASWALLYSATAFWRAFVQSAENAPKRVFHKKIVENTLKKWKTQNVRDFIR